jgi:hypothetical protein
MWAVLLLLTVHVYGLPVIFVSNSSSSAVGNGTEANPCLNMKCALQLLEQNSTINILPGIYTGPDNTNLTFPSYLRVSLVGLTSGGLSITSLHVISSSEIAGGESVVFDCQSSLSNAAIPHRFATILDSGVSRISRVTLQRCRSSLLVDTLSASATPSTDELAAELRALRGSPSLSFDRTFGGGAVLLENTKVAEPLQLYILQVFARMF